MIYDSPTLRFVSFAVLNVYDNISELETDFWRGFWFVIFTLAILGVIGAIIISSITYNKWIGLGILIFIGAIEIMSVIGAVFKLIVG